MLLQLNSRRRRHLKLRPLAGITFEVGVDSNPINTGRIGRIEIEHLSPTLAEMKTSAEWRVIDQLLLKLPGLMHVELRILRETWEGLANAPARLTNHSQLLPQMSQRNVTTRVYSQIEVHGSGSSRFPAHQGFATDYLPEGGLAQVRTPNLAP